MTLQFRDIGVRYCPLDGQMLPPPHHHSTDSNHCYAYVEVYTYPHDTGIFTTQVKLAKYSDQVYVWMAISRNC